MGQEAYSRFLPPKPLTREQFLPTAQEFLSIKKGGCYRTLDWASLLLELWGGAISEVTPDATAFPYRAEGLVSMQLSASWKHSSDCDIGSCKAWLHGLYKAGTALGEDNTSYVNYPHVGDEFAEGWGQKYYGSAHFTRLQKVKRQLDPTNFFAYNQSIPLPKGP